jgi:hypothetical protein
MSIEADVTSLLVEWTLRNESGARTLQPTALVHEAYLLLVQHSMPDWESRAHFFGVAAYLMRQLLVEQARRNQTQKRGQGSVHLPFDEALTFAPKHGSTGKRKAKRNDSGPLETGRRAPAVARRSVRRRYGDAGRGGVAAGQRCGWRGMDMGIIRNRFCRERQTLARLQNPHIARLLDGSPTAEGEPSIVMGYIEGDRITDHCRVQALNTGRRLEQFLDVGKAVDYARRQFVVQRDLKRGNILVDRPESLKPVLQAMGPRHEGHRCGALLPLDRPLTPRRMRRLDRNGLRGSRS